MVSPEFENLVAAIRAAPRLDAPTVDDLRANWNAFTASFKPAADIVFSAEIADTVPVEWTDAPDVRHDRVILYFHGGGYSIGSVASYRSFVGRLSRAAGMRALSVEYRLAPEHPFPAAVEDCVAAYRWLIENYVAAEHVVLAGDSAGGGLAFATAALAREQGLPCAGAIVAISPSTDLAREGASVRERAHLDPIVNLEATTAHAARYLGQTDPKTPLASPLYADLHGLPPTLVMVGTSEMLFDDAAGIADKAERAGVDVELDVWEDMIHIWPFFADVLPEGVEAIEKIGRFMQAKLG
ncbi:alpha/beta hydrolase [Sphingomonas panacis]|uniref:alpha/beta hydrolase n=1 Tax=Sphingomonas panacis TaxID=1560345 RepID=UPI000AC3AE68|nr:alpha/beta hydrolase [Sphingomonas panacis]